MAMILQTPFLTVPFGWSLFYLLSTATALVVWLPHAIGL